MSLRPSGKDWAEFPGFSFQGTIMRSGSHHDYPAENSRRGRGHSDLSFYRNDENNDDEEKSR